MRTTEVGCPDAPVALAKVFDDLVTQVAERNPDFYQAVDGRIAAAS